MTGSDYTAYGEAFFSLLSVAAITLLISVPLAIWKLVDIAVWVWRHVSITWGA